MGVLLDGTGRAGHRATWSAKPMSMHSATCLKGCMHFSPCTSHSRVLRVLPCCQAVVSPQSFAVDQATNSAELRSIASLRAANFFDMENATCSDFAARSHLRVKADAIWEYLEDSYSNRDDEGPRLVCFFASICEDTEVAQAMRQQMDLSCKLPRGDGPARVVLGSLDLSIGATLGGEKLAGKLPEGPDARLRRAYISNVSVALPARRLGVASALLAAAYQHAGSVGVQHLYVHAAVDNPAALQLYSQRCGYEVETEENAATAKALNRPRRKLFHKAVVP